MPKHNLLIVALSAVILVGSTVAAVVIFSAEGDPSQANRIPCPAVGPAGQTGEMTCYESIPSPYAGGAKEFGPYRLLPPGTKFIERDYGIPPASSDFTEVADKTAIRNWRIYVAPPGGAVERTLAGRALRNDPLQVFSTWDVEGKTVNVIATAYSGALLPIDVYLYFPSSRISVSAEMIGGRYVIVDQPTTGPAPNVGYVAVWLDGFEIAFRSPEHDHKVLRALAEAIIAKSK